MADSPVIPPRACHVMTKPIGPICNLDCKYCFYLEKEKLYPDRSNWRMPDAVLDAYIRQYIEAQDVPEINFAWQGGEPTLMGVEFFRRAVELQQKYCPPGKRITNAMQTNGTLLDDEWCAFLHENQFLVGLSIDGPREIHDRYRVDKGGKPSFDQVMAGMALLKKYKVEFNTLTVVQRHNAKKPLEVYRFLRDQGSGFMQFIPIVERAGETSGQLSEPPLLSKRSLPIINPQSAIRNPQSPASQIENRKSKIENSVTPWSVLPEDFGHFLITIFDEWVGNDVGRTFVQLFDVQLGIWMGMPASLCVFAETCGAAMAMEHNGDLYSCDHFVYPRYHLGNIMDRPIIELAAQDKQRQFGQDKLDALPKYCRECDVRFACNGECPKHRFLTTPDGEPGLNYLCAGYKKFFHHIDPYMQAMARLVRQGQPAAGVMDMVRQRDQQQRQQAAIAQAGRNDPCPCGSGKKYKKCCGGKSPIAG